MTETNSTPAEGMEMQPVTVKLSKLTEGIGILFAGVLTMLESLDASSAQRLLDGLKPQQTENEKYAFRCWMLRLGFIGEEFETAREILLRNMDGNAAWRQAAC